MSSSADSSLPEQNEVEPKAERAAKPKTARSASPLKNSAAADWRVRQSVDGPFHAGFVRSRDCESPIHSPGIGTSITSTIKGLFLEGCTVNVATDLIER